MNKRFIRLTASAAVMTAMVSGAQAVTYLETFQTLTPGGANPLSDYGVAPTGSLAAFSNALFSGSWTEIESTPVSSSSSVRVLGVASDRFLDFNVGVEGMTVNLTFAAAASSVIVSFQYTGTDANSGLVATSTLSPAYSSGTLLPGDSDGVPLNGLSNPTVSAPGGGLTFSTTFTNVAAGSYTFTMLRAAGSVGAVGIDDFKVDAIAAVVPEPETYAMMLAGLAGMVFVARRRSQRGG